MTHTNSEQQVFFVKLKDSKAKKKERNEILNRQEMLNLFDVVEIAPMRSLDEFILSKSRFEAPNFNNIDKWTNRINNNLLYYQTNYFFSMLVIFIIVTVLHPGEMMLGIIIMSSGLLSFRDILMNIS